ncbi:MAG: hypothetical protein KAT57_04985 [Candidatus Lokiarchaeota archaeon]|nr:hypothetical protein [Candidatus Lokiarchaeota archaeon]
MITELVSELFNHINSQESFDYISDLLINSLSKYKNTISTESYSEQKEIYGEKINVNDINTLQYDLDESKNEYLAISNDIHSILSNCQELTNGQKLDFCNNQRYFMKLFLKELLIKLNKV